MSFVESNLLDGEKIVYRARLHWYIIIKAIILQLIIFILYANIGSKLYDSINGFINQEHIIILFISICFLAFVYVLYVILQYSTTEIFVTNKRISRKKGIISRISVDIKLDMIETVIFTQKIIGRIFDYGHVYFNGVGTITQKFHGVSKPLELRNVIIKQINQNVLLKDIVIEQKKINSNIKQLEDKIIEINTEKHIIDKMI